MSIAQNLTNFTIVGTYLQDYLVYPNPTKDRVIVNSKNKNTSIFKLSNTLGVTIAVKEVVQGVNNIDLKNIIPGIYIYNILGDNGTIQTGKLIIE